MFTSPEISKKLYELSKWGEKIQEERLELWAETEDGKFYIMSQGGKGFPTKIWPAYSLGYLLRKLPSDRFTLQKRGNVWRSSGFGIEAKTPEEAVAQYLIKLFEEGVLE